MSAAGNRGPWSNTASGRRFYLMDPRSEDVHVEDVSSHLSRICRFNGALKDGIDHFSVAEHAFNISRWMEEDGYTPEICFAALHHDSAEAYTGDITAPVKQAVPSFRELEKRVTRAVFMGLGVPHLNTWDWDAIKRYDLIALATEVEQLLDRTTPVFTEVDSGHAWAPRAKELRPVGPLRAQVLFLSRHFELIRTMEADRVQKAFA